MKRRRTMAQASTALTAIQRDWSDWRNITWAQQPDSAVSAAAAKRPVPGGNRASIVRPQAARKTR